MVFAFLYSVEELRAFMFVHYKPAVADRFVNGAVCDTVEPAAAGK